MMATTTGLLRVVFMVGCVFLLPSCDAYCSDEAGKLYLNGDLRLAGGSNSYEGRVEICYNNTWGTICDDSWDNDDATVVCRQLGLPTERDTAYSTAYFGEGRGPIWLDDVNCAGYEGALSSCLSSSYGNHNCGHFDDAGVSCGDAVATTPAPICSSGDVKLIGGSDSYEGRVEICHNNRWGTVCDDIWGNDDARVVCRQLGLPTSGATAYYNAHFGQGTGQIWLDNVSCFGSEFTLDSCVKRPYGEYDCDHSDDAGVRCQEAPTTKVTTSPPPCTDGSIRLVNGSQSYEGRVELCHGNQWGTVCDDSWDKFDARVVCRHLYLPIEWATPYSSAHFGQGSGQIWLDDVNCDGSEYSLDECSDKSSYGDHNCGHQEDAGVSCGRSQPTVSAYCTSDEAGDVRLVGGTSYYEGRVEICHNLLWGTVCDNYWSYEDAKVVCRQLGYETENAVSFPGGTFVAGTGKIWLDNVTCFGYEARLEDCISLPIGNTYCIFHSRDAGVRCGNGDSYSCTDGELRLVGGSDVYEGRVELCHNKEWGTVCDDSWDDDDARVVCRQLGLPTDDVKAYSYAHFGQGSGPIWMDEVHCDGYEGSLTYCYSVSYGFGYNDCNHFEDAGVSCKEKKSCSSITSEDCRTFYGATIGGSVGGVLLIASLCITIISIFTRRKRRRQAVRVSTAGGGGRSTGQATYRPLQQYPPPTVTTVGSTSSPQTGMGSTESYTTPAPLYQYHQSGDSFIATEHAQFDEIPNEDPPPYSESDPLLLRDQQAQLENEQDEETVSASFYPQGGAEDIQNEGEEATIVVTETADDFDVLEFNTTPTTSTRYSDTNVEEQKAPV